MRVVRLVRHSTGLQLLFNTLHRSANELAMLYIYLLVSMVSTNSRVEVTFHSVYLEI